MKPSAIARFYVYLNALHDFAYFGLLIVHFLILDRVFERLLPASLAPKSEGFAIAMIASQLVWQVLAEGPTGAYADVFGRAKAVAASFYCKVIAVVLVVTTALLTWEGILAEVPGLFVAAIVLAQILMATGEALLEGSIEAWLRDEMSVASPNAFEALVDRAFGTSAVAQNAAILASTAIFLGLLQFRLRGLVIGLALLAGLVFLVGATVASIAASREKFVRERERRMSVGRTIRKAVTSLFQIELPAVRRIVVVLILPFPCWVLLSWFYQAFVPRTRPNENAELPQNLLLWLGLALAVARVAGAWWGNRITRNEKGRDVQRVFELAVTANVAFLFIGGTVLFLIPVLKLPVALAGTVFLVAAALAKGSEEVVKLAKNRLLAVLVADAKVRATILSLVSIAQNGFGFAALLLAALLTIPSSPTPGRQTVLMFWICGIFAVIGVLVIAFSSRTRSHREGLPGPEKTW